MIFSVSLAITGQAFATDYYVNSSSEGGCDGLSDAITEDGSGHCAFETIAEVNASSPAGDDAVLFNKGQVWYEKLIPPTNGTDGHQITYGAYGTGAKPIISGATVGAPTTPARNNCVQLGDDGYAATRYYLTFDGLEFAYPTEYGINQIKDSDTPGVIVQNCTFTKCGIRLEGANALIQDNIFNGPTALATGEAINLKYETCTSPQILRNTISTYVSRGIWIQTGVDSPTVNYNTITTITGGEGYGVDFDGYAKLITGHVEAIGNVITGVTGGNAGWGIYCENKHGSSQVSYNVISNCTSSGAPSSDTGAGIYYLSYSEGTYYADQRGVNVNGIITNNIIYDCNRGIGTQDTAGLDIWNNTIDDGVSQTPKGVALGGSVAAYATDIDIRNNIFGSGFSYVVSLPEDSWEDSIVAFDYNRFEDITVINERGGDDHSLAILQGESKALNCFTTAPGFTDDGGNNYTLASDDSPCIGAGADLGNGLLYGLDPTSSWPDNVKPIDQDSYGDWEIGAYVYIEAAELGGPGTIAGGGSGSIAGGGSGSIIGTAP